MKLVLVVSMNGRNFQDKNSVLKSEQPFFRFFFLFFFQGPLYGIVVPNTDRKLII